MGSSVPSQFHPLFSLQYQGNLQPLCVCFFELPRNGFKIQFEAYCCCISDAGNVGFSAMSRNLNHEASVIGKHEQWCGSRSVGNKRVSRTPSKRELLLERNLVMNHRFIKIRETFTINKHQPTTYLFWRKV